MWRIYKFEYLHKAPNGAMIISMYGFIYVLRKMHLVSLNDYRYFDNGIPKKKQLEFRKNSFSLSKKEEEIKNG